VQALYTVLLALRRGDPVLARQDRHALHVRALTADVLAVHWWHEGQERLLLANFGPSMTADLPAITGQRVEANPVRLPATTDPPGGLPAVGAAPPPNANGHDLHEHAHGKESANPPEGWNVVLDTGERRFGGAGAGSVVEGGLLALPERTAVLLAKYG
jgi:hypothetical protein